MPALDPDARLFFEGLSMDCLSAPEHVRWQIEHGVDLTPEASHLGDQLLADHASEFDQLLIAAALWVAQGVCAHLAGAWISDEGRPVMLVAASDEGGDISDDYLLDFQQVFESVRLRYRSGEDSQS